jgi:hypothetical protein
MSFSVVRIALALTLVAVTSTVCAADTTVRGLSLWPSDSSPGLLGLVKGRLDVDNLNTDNTGFHMEVSSGGETTVFEFPAENCRQHKNGDHTCISNAEGQRRAQRRILIRNRGGSSVSRVKFYLANSGLPAPGSGSVNIELTSAGGTYGVDSGACTRRQRFSSRARYRCEDGTGVSCVNPAPVPVAACAARDSGDTTAPSAVTGMQLSTVGDDLRVDWTNPGTDFGGVILLRQARQPIFVNGPADGAEVGIGDTVDGVEVVYTGGDSCFTDTTAIPGINYAYTAIAADCSLNYGDVADQVMGVHALPTQRATLSISDPAGSPVVTVTSAPSDMNLAISAAAAAGGELSFTVSATNNLAATLIHPKVEILSVSEGAASGTGGTTLAGDPFYRFMTSLPLEGDSAAFQARLALASGATADQGVVLTGVTGAVDPLVVELEIGFDPTVAYHDNGEYYQRDTIIAMFQDTGTNTIAPIQARASGAILGMLHGACGAVQFTADNRWMLCASSHQGVLKIYDMAEFGVQKNPSVFDLFINHDSDSIIEGPPADEFCPTVVEEELCDGEYFGCCEWQDGTEGECVSIIGDGQCLGSDDGDIGYWDARYSNSSPFRGLRLSPDGSRVYATIGSTNNGAGLPTYWKGMDVVEIDISDPENPAELRRLSLESGISEEDEDKVWEDQFTSEHMALSPDGRTIAFLTHNRRPADIRAATTPSACETAGGTWFISWCIANVIFVVDTVTMTQIGDAVETGDFYGDDQGKSLTWRGNLGFVLAGGREPSGYGNQDAYLLYVDALDDFRTATIAVTGRFNYRRDLPSGSIVYRNTGDWFNVLDLQGRLWDSTSAFKADNTGKLLHVTDWHPDQATATATPLSGLLSGPVSYRGWRSLNMSADGQYIYLIDEEEIGDSNTFRNTCATISVDTFAAEPVPAAEWPITTNSIRYGADNNDWAAMTQR